MEMCQHFPPPLGWIIAKNIQQNPKFPIQSPFLHFNRHVLFHFLSLYIYLTLHLNHNLYSAPKKTKEETVHIHFNGFFSVIAPIDRKREKVAIFFS